MSIFFINFFAYFSGLDNAGKSTVLDRWIKSQSEVNDSASASADKKDTKICPTFGFEIKTILTTLPDSHSPIRLNFWDIGGQKSIRPFWRNYYEETDAIVWVIDSADSDRLEMCKEELQSVLNADVITFMTIVPFLIFYFLEIIRCLFVDLG